MRSLPCHLLMPTAAESAAGAVRYGLLPRQLSAPAMRAAVCDVSEVQRLTRVSKSRWGFQRIWIT